MFGGFAQTQFVQTAYTALTNTGVPDRGALARWLLICHDRVEGDELTLTHEFYR